MKHTVMSDVFDLPLTSTKDMIFQDNSDDYIECEYDVDAKAIVFAVNNHDRIIELLEGCYDYINAEMKGEIRPVNPKCLLVAIQNVKLSMLS